MYISKISLTPNYKIQYSKSKNNTAAQNQSHTQTTVNLNNCPSFGSNTFNFVPVEESSFTKQGGSLDFGFAKGPKGIPYSGRIVNDSKNMQLISTYHDGKKTSMSLAWSQRDDMDDIFIHFKKNSEFKNTYNGKTIVWTNEANDVEYSEDYSPEGKLLHTSLIGYKSGSDNTVVMTVQREYEPDGITPYREQTDVSEEFKNLFGYTTRLSLIVNGKVQETSFNTVSKDGTRLADRRTVFYDKNRKIYKSREENVTYLDSENKVPYATSEERVAFTDKDGHPKVRDYEFKTTDYSQGAGPVRKFMYEEHPHTIRDIKGNRHIYYDGITKKRYAAEEYNGKQPLPSLIVSYEKQCAAEIKEFGKNSIFMDVYTNYQNKATSLLIQRQGKEYKIKQIDVFDPKTGKRNITKRIYDDGTVQTTFYNEKGEITNTQKQLPKDSGEEN